MGAPPPNLAVTSIRSVDDRVVATIRNLGPQAREARARLTVDGRPAGDATATIGSTVAARTLGEVIIAGLLSDNLAFIVQGGLIVSVLAVLIFDSIALLERRAGRFGRNGQAVREMRKGR